MNIASRHRRAFAPAPPRTHRLAMSLLLSAVVLGLALPAAAQAPFVPAPVAPVPVTPAPFAVPPPMPAPFALPQVVLPPVTPSPGPAFVWTSPLAAVPQHPQEPQHWHEPLLALEPLRPSEPLWPREALPWHEPLPLLELSLSQAPSQAPSPAPRPFTFALSGNAERLYDQARRLIEDNRYDRALESLERVIQMRSDRTDAAMYWKAYSLARIARGADALATIADLQKQFADSRWIRDARALEVEVRQASGQAVSADSQNNDELKLLALRGLMQSNPDSALPVIEKMMAGTSSPRVKEQALFVLSQSRSAKARELILGVAKGGSNPDLQLKAIRYLGMAGVTQSGQVLDEIYRTSSDVAVKRAILRGFMASGARDRLLAVAKSETSADLRGEAVQQLGALGASSELLDLYRSEASGEVKKRILQGMLASRSVEGLATMARTETDPDLRRTAIRNLGATHSSAAAEALLSLYASDTSADARKAVIGALSMQNNARPLVDLARAEKNPELKKEIVAKLSTMRSKEATDYLLELLK
jgi:hypothetical protein